MYTVFQQIYTHSLFLAQKWPFPGERMNHIGWSLFMPTPSFYLIFMGMNTWKFGHKQSTIHKYRVTILPKFLFHLLYTMYATSGESGVSENWSCWLMNLIAWRTNIQPKLWKLQNTSVFVNLQYNVFILL